MYIWYLFQVDFLPQISELYFTERVIRFCCTLINHCLFRRLSMESSRAFFTVLLTFGIISAVFHFLAITTSGWICIYDEHSNYSYTVKINSYYSSVHKCTFKVYNKHKKVCKTIDIEDTSK